MLLLKQEDEERILCAENSYSSFWRIIAGSLSITPPSQRTEKLRLMTGSTHLPTTLKDMMNATDHGIPHDLLGKAKCVVIIPGMKKAGFIIGAKYGRGFAVCRHAGGTTSWARRRQCRLKVAALGSRLEPSGNGRDTACHE